MLYPCIIVIAGEYDWGLSIIPTSFLPIHPLLRVPEHINLALQAKRIYSGSLWQTFWQMHPNPNPTFQKNVKKDGYF